MKTIIGSLVFALAIVWGYGVFKGMQACDSNRKFLEVTAISMNINDSNKTIPIIDNLLLSGIKTGINICTSFNTGK